VEYTFLYNLTGFPAAVFPVTKVQENEQGFSDQFNDSWTKTLNKDAKNSVGMPICLSLGGYAFEDEKVLGILK